MIAELIALAGALLIALAGIGVLRFGDVIARMHALAKASTLGVVLVLVGAALALDHANDYTSAGLAALLQMLTSPVSAHLIGRATYLTGRDSLRLDAGDELAPQDVAHGQHRE